jgi:hypothetical protein
MLYTFLAVLLVSALLISIQAISEEKNKNTQLLDQFKTEAIAIDNLIVRVTVLLDLMQNNAEDFFLNPRPAASIYFNGLATIGANEYGLDTIPSPYSVADAGNVTGQGDLAALSPAVKNEIEMAFNLNSDFKSTLKSVPNAAWVYYTSKNKFINIYPWTSSAEFKFTEKLYNKEFYTLGIPTANPDKNIFWTSVYLDEAGKGVMVTAAKPVYNQDEFLGTVAIDFTLGELGNYVKAFRPELGELSIINASGQLLAHTRLPPKLLSLAMQYLPALSSMRVRPAALICNWCSSTKATKWCVSN